MIPAKQVIAKARELIGCAYKWAGDFTVPDDIVTVSNVYAWQHADPAHFSALKFEQLTHGFIGKLAGDCSGLVTHCLGLPKIFSGELFDMCEDKHKFDQNKPLNEQIPQDAAIVVWREGHIGLFVGDGFVIESGSTKYGVKATFISDPITGNPWTHYGYLRRYIDYSDASTVTKDDTRVGTATGDVYGRQEPTTRSAVLTTYLEGKEIRFNGRRTVSGTVWLHDTAGPWVSGRFVGGFSFDDLPVM